jgi:hypothetical protein
MSCYNPDPKLQDAVLLMQSEHLSPSEEVLVYYIKHQKLLIAEYQRKLMEYGEFFTKLNSFLPSNNPILR